MHIVRVNHKNGLYLEFLFLDPGRAEVCANTCADAFSRGHAHPPKDARCEIRDEAGRQTWLDGAQIQSIQLAAIEDEVRFNTRLSVIVNMTTQQWLKEMGLSNHPAAANLANGRAPAPPEVQASTDAPGTIGSFSA